MKNVFTIIGAVLLSLLLITGCGSTQPIMSGGEYHEAGFFLGLFGGLLWPLTFIFYLVGFISPYYGASAMYYHYNSGFGYWLGFIIGFLPYMGLFFGKISNGKNEKS
jgi:hypothetical protein